MTADEPVEGRLAQVESETPPGEPGKNSAHDDGLAGRPRWEMPRVATSPSVPVESREQPRGSMQHRIDVAVIGMANDRAERWKQRCFTARTETAERDATIRELRAEAAREFESGNEWCQRALASEAALETTRAERDRARDLAAHLEEDTGKRRATR